MNRRKLIQKLQQLIDRLPISNKRKEAKQDLLSLKLNKSQYHDIMIFDKYKKNLQQTTILYYLFIIQHYTQTKINYLVILIYRVVVLFNLPNFSHNRKAIGSDTLSLLSNCIYNLYNLRSTQQIFKLTSITSYISQLTTNIH